MSTELADALRTVSFALGASIIATHAVLWWRIYRFVVPPVAARVVIISAVLLLGVILADVVSHVGEPFHWEIIPRLLGLFLHQLGLLWFYRWTWRPDGRIQRHRLRGDREAVRLLEEEGMKP